MRWVGVKMEWNGMEWVSSMNGAKNKYLRPMQLRGPPPKGRNIWVGLRVSLNFLSFFLFFSVAGIYTSCESYPWSDFFLPALRSEVVRVRTPDVSTSMKGMEVHAYQCALTNENRRFRVVSAAFGKHNVIDGNAGGSEGDRIKSKRCSKRVLADLQNKTQMVGVELSFTQSLRYFNFFKSLNVGFLPSRE